MNNIPGPRIERGTLHGAMQSEKPIPKEHMTVKVKSDTLWFHSHRD